MHICAKTDMRIYPQIDVFVQMYRATPANEEKRSGTELGHGVKKKAKGDARQ